MDNIIITELSGLSKNTESILTAYERIADFHEQGQCTEEMANIAISIIVQLSAKNIPLKVYVNKYGKLRIDSRVFQLNVLKSSKITLITYIQCDINKKPSRYIKQYTYTQIPDLINKIKTELFNKC